MRDYQISKVYAAETSIKKYKKYKKRVHCQIFVDKIVASRWWTEKCKIFSIYHQLIVILPAKTLDPHIIGELPYIFMPQEPFYYNEYTLCHEMTHILLAKQKNISDHGKEFCGVNLAIVKRFMGDYYYNILKNKYKEHQVDILNIQRFEKKIKERE